MGELGKETTEARGGQISPAFVAAPFRIAAASPAASAMNQEGDVKDVRFVKGGGARAIRTLRAATCPEPGDRVVPLSPQMVGLRFTAAAAAAAAGGVEHRVTAHSGRVGRASEPPPGKRNGPAPSRRTALQRWTGRRSSGPIKSGHDMPDNIAYRAVRAPPRAR